jgi:hypothetical protein
MEPQLNPDFKSLSTEQAQQEFSDIFPNWRKDWPHLVKTASEGGTAIHHSGISGNPLSQEEHASFNSMFPDVEMIHCNDSVPSTSVVNVPQRNFRTGDNPFSPIQSEEEFAERFPELGSVGSFNRISGLTHDNQFTDERTGVHGTSQRMVYTTSRYVGQEGAGVLTPPPTPESSSKLVSGTLQGPFDDAPGYFPLDDRTEGTVISSHASSEASLVPVHYLTPPESPADHGLTPISTPFPTYRIHRKPVPFPQGLANQVPQEQVSAAASQSDRSDSGVETVDSTIPSISQPSSPVDNAELDGPFDPVCAPLALPLATSPPRMDGAPSSGKDLFAEDFWKQLDQIVERCSNVSSMVGLPSRPTVSTESRQSQWPNEQGSFEHEPAEDPASTISNRLTLNSFAPLSTSTRASEVEHGRHTKRSGWRKRIPRFARSPRARPSRMEIWSQTGSRAVKKTQQPFAARLKKGLGRINNPFKSGVIIG